MIARCLQINDSSYLFFEPELGLSVRSRASLHRESESRAGQPSNKLYFHSNHAEESIQIWATPADLNSPSLTLNGPLR